MIIIECITMWQRLELQTGYIFRPEYAQFTPYFYTKCDYYSPCGGKKVDPQQ